MTKKISSLPTETMTKLVMAVAGLAMAALLFSFAPVTHAASLDASLGSPTWFHTGDGGQCPAGWLAVGTSGWWATYTDVYNLCRQILPSPTVTFSASPTAVNSGSQSTLTWGSTGATSCAAGGPWSNSGALSGTGLTNPLTSPTTFTFQCTGPGGTSPLLTRTVAINPPPTVTLAASPSTIYGGQSTKLTWNSSGGATSCNFPNSSSLYKPGAYPANNTSGLSTGPLTSSQYYQISCTGPSGTGNSNIVPVTVLVPTASISVTPSRVPKGTPTTVSWKATNVTSCNITRNGNPWQNLARLRLVGSAPDIITVQTTYAMTCKKNVFAQVVVSAQTTVNVAPGYHEF